MAAITMAMNKELPSIPTSPVPSSSRRPEQSSSSSTSSSPELLYSRARLRPVRQGQQQEQQPEMMRTHQHMASGSQSSDSQSSISSWPAVSRRGTPAQSGPITATTSLDHPSPSSARGRVLAYGQASASSSSSSSSPASSSASPASALWALRQQQVLAGSSSSPTRQAHRQRSARDLRSSGEGRSDGAAAARAGSSSKQPSTMSSESSLNGFASADVTEFHSFDGTTPSNLLEDKSQYETPEGIENFVVALHDFESTNETCLSFKAGQTIKVYNRDESGWWDGEIDGIRGWFPSNYVSLEDEATENAYGGVEVHDQGGQSEQDGARQSDIVARTPNERGDPLDSSTGSATLRYASSEISRSSVQSRSPTPTADNITKRDAMPPSSLREEVRLTDPFFDSLDPIRHAIALLRNAVKARRASHFQPSTACVISSVRSVLSTTDCLTRESAVLKAHPVLARERKQILAELSKLVTQARSSSAAAAAASALSDGDEMSARNEMDLMLVYADHVLDNVRRFLEVAQECGVDIVMPSPVGSEAVLGDEPSAQSGLSGGMQNGQVPDRSDQDKTPTPDSPCSSPTKTRLTPPRAASSTNDLRSASRMSREGARSAGGSSVSNMLIHAARMQSDGRLSRTPDLRRYSVSSNEDAEHRYSSPSGDLDSPGLVQMPVQTLCSPAEVLEHINAANDQLLSIIAAFIGHIHSHSRDSHASSFAFLIDTTRATVDGVRALLVIVEAVHNSPTLQQSQAEKMALLWETRESVYEATAALVTAARVMTASQPATAESEESRKDKAMKASEGDLVSRDSLDDVDEKTRLLQCATAVLRTGSECVGSVKACLMSVDASLRILLVTTPLSTKSTSRTESDEAAEDVEAVEEYTSSRRNNHTLSFLGRKATSLNCLRERYENTISSSAPPSSLLGTFSEDAEDANSHGNEQTENLDGQRLSGGNKSANGADSSDSSENMSRQHSRASASTTRSAQTDITVDTSTRPSMEQSREPISASSVEDHVPQTAPLSGAFPRELSSAKANHPRHRSTSLSRFDNRWPSPTAGQRSTSDPAASRSTIPDDQSSLLSDEAVLGNGFEATEVCYNSEGQLTGATLSALIEKLTPHGTTIDPTLLNAFFMCFRLFTTPMAVFDELRARYEMTPPAAVEADADTHSRWMEGKVAPIRLRIFNFFKLWLENHWNASCDYDILEPLIEFTKTSMTHSLYRPGQRLAELAEKRLEVGKEAQTAHFAVTSNATGNIVRGPGSLKRVVSSDRARGLPGLTELSNMYTPSSYPAKGAALPPAPAVSKSLMNQLRSGDMGKINVLEFDPQELARQITILESRIYCSILPEELIGQEFSKKAGVSSAVHIKNMSSLSTHITGWVSECVLGEADTRKRTQLIKFFIKLGDRCLGLNNFNTLFAIQGALNSSTISRLKKTWSGLSAKNRALMEQQRNAVEHTRNFASYRQRLRSTMAPALPFVGLFLTDLTFCHEGNASTRASPLDTNMQLINFDKYVKMSRIIGDLQRFQQPYLLLEVPEVQNYLRFTLEEVQQHKGLKSADELYRRSLFLEPRSAAPAPAVSSLIGASSGLDNGSTAALNAGGQGRSGGMNLDIFHWKGLPTGGLEGKLSLNR